MFINSVLLNLFVCLLVLNLLVSSPFCKALSLSGCLWTGCANHNCSINQMIKVATENCHNGTNYLCCPLSSSSLDLSVAESKQVAYAEDSSDSGCWWTGCQKDSWDVVGCDQYDMDTRNTRNCADGKEYQCCPGADSEEESSESPEIFEPTMVTSISTETIIKPVDTDCWWTGCQKNDWADVGCSVYNRTEKDKRECENGNEYFCCVSTAIPEKPVSKEKECWWSTCQLKSWDKRGCADDMEFKSSLPCPDGDLFECCREKKITENEIEPISGNSFDNFVKYLLLKSHNFSIEPKNLQCSQLDPEKSIVMQVGENDGVRICDLCPNLPLLYLKDIFLDRIPSNTTSNVDFQDCFGFCEFNPRCLAFSYDQEAFKCYMFNSTVGIFTSDSNWKTVLMNQPSGIIENWLYIRHTSISGYYHKIEQRPNFRDCLKACSIESMCNHVSYDIQASQCKMYNNASSIDYIDMNYGWLTAFNLTDIPSDNTDVSWRFTRDENDLDKLASNESLSNDCSKQHNNKTHSAFFSKDCYTSGAVGCDAITGCKMCYYPEETDELFSYNLQICPDSIMAKASRIADQVLKRMKTCLSNDKCFGIGVNGKEEFAEEILPDLLSKEYQTRYMLRYPEKNIGLHKFLLKNDFLPDFELVQVDITQDFSESKQENLEDCLIQMNKNDNIKKISYSLVTKICKIAGNQVSMRNKPSQGLITMIKHPDISSNLAYYTAIYGTSLDISKAKFSLENCQPNCEELCSKQCQDEYKSWCGYFTLSFEKGKTRCSFYEDDDSLKVSHSNNTSIYKRTTTVKFDLDSLNQLNLISSDDIYNCFSSSTDLIQESTKSIKKSEIILRSRRGIFDKIGNFFKKIGKAVVDTVKKTVDTVVDTAKGAVKSVGKLIKGDVAGAKDAFMKIPIVNDVKNVVELGGAVIKGDWNKAKEKGADLLQSSTLDLVTSVIPGGKIIGKGLSAAGKAISNTGKAAKDKIKSTVNKLDTKDKKVKDGENNSKANNKPENNKNRDEERRGSQCENRRPKRAPNSRKKPGDDCDDDDDKKGRCDSPKDQNIITETAKKCDNKKVNDKCAFECNPGYDENDPEVTCKKIGNKFEWNPMPKCSLKNCPNGNEVLISLETPKNRLGAVGTSKTIVAYSVLFDKRRKLPVWSIALHQSDAFATTSYNDLTDKDRESDFKQYPCTDLSRNQANDDDYAKTGWDRGHLTPANIARWSRKAALSSNLYINAAPQDPKTNSGAWKRLEAHVQCFGSRRRMLVATGICQNSNGKTKSSGIEIPSCYWKMLCYKDENSNEVVVGFKSDNTKVSTNSDYELRKNQIYNPISQAEIKKLITGVSVRYKSPWLATATELNKGREAVVGADSSVWLPVNPYACEQADELLPAESEGWKASLFKTSAELDRGKNPKQQKSKKTKRQAPVLDRGCHPDEFESALALVGAAALGAGLGVGNSGDGTTEFESDADIGDGSVKVSVGSCGKRIIGYYTSWGKKPITGTMMQRLTHVIYAFLEIGSDGKVFIGSPDRKNSANINEETNRAKSRLEHLMTLRKMYPHVKILFAVGGWENSQYFSSIAASSSMRNTFMTSIVKLIEQWGFDGVDIDWEYPVTGGANEGISADKINYVNLMKELRGLLDALADEAGRSNKYLISFAGAAGQWTLDPGFDLPGLLKYADFANIMTYDFFGAWASKWGAYTGSPAPLFFGMPPRFSGKTNVDWTVKYYSCKSKMPHKLNMGVPFYGRYWKNVGDPIDKSDGMWRLAQQVNGKFEGDFVPWNKIESEYSSANGFTTSFHEKSKTPYAWNPASKIFLGFENPESLNHKVKYAVDKNVGGLMIWAIDLDDDQLTLLNVVSKASLCTNTDPNNLNYVCSPIDEKRWWTSEDGDDKAGLCGKSAPLYKGYYPVCDPDDPGYSCCGKFGFCGTGPDYCNCPTCKDYGKDPRKILEGAIKPSIPITWYLLSDPDGKRGRCGRKIPKINGIYPTCNPDDDNSYCCSNGGYCGSTTEHCDCNGCINFRKNPNYQFGPKKWWTLEDGKDLGGQCGPKAPKVDGIYEAECEPESQSHYCCSPEGWCGSGSKFCDCQGCKNFKTG